MAQKTFHCRVVTPTAKLVDEEVTYASLPAWDGLMGVLPGRAPIVARLGLGELRLDFPETTKAGNKAGGSRGFLVEGGFVQMSSAGMMILAEKATPVEEISPQKAEEELRALTSKSIPANTPNRLAEVAKLQKQVEVARAKVGVSRRGGGI